MAEVLASQARSIADAANGISDRCLGVSEVPAAPCAEVSAMGMHAEPVAIQVWMSTIRARNVLHFIPKYRTDHIVDGVDLRNHNSFFRTTIAEDLDCSLRAVHALIAAGILRV